MVYYSSEDILRLSSSFSSVLDGIFADYLLHSSRVFFDSAVQSLRLTLPAFLPSVRFITKDYDINGIVQTTFSISCGEYRFKFRERIENAVSVLSFFKETLLQLYLCNICLVANVLYLSDAVESFRSKFFPSAAKLCFNAVLSANKPIFRISTDCLTYNLDLLSLSGIDSVLLALSAPASSPLVCALRKMFREGAVFFYFRNNLLLRTLGVRRMRQDLAIKRSFLCYPSQESVRGGRVATVRPDTWYYRLVGDVGEVLHINTDGSVLVSYLFKVALHSNTKSI